MKKYTVLGNFRLLILKPFNGKNKKKRIEYPRTSPVFWYLDKDLITTDKRKFTLKDN